MANIWIKAISILAGNLNSGLSYQITTVSFLKFPTGDDRKNIKNSLELKETQGVMLRDKSLSHFNWIVFFIIDIVSETKNMCSFKHLQLQCPKSKFNTWDKPVKTLFLDLQISPISSRTKYQDYLEIKLRV